MTRKLVARLTLILLTFSFFGLKAQSLEIKRVDPTNWWVGMSEPMVQLSFYGIGIGESELSLAKYKGVKIRKVTRVENSNYLFVDIEINAKAKSGDLIFSFESNGQIVEQSFELLDREDLSLSTLGSKDIVYLLMPDRFSNAVPSNDKFEDMADTESDRNNPWLRHGGDLQGVTQHLDYFKELGVTALWLNPVLENDQAQTNEGGNMRSAYHGYGFTDLYNVDRRLGGNSAYKKLINEAHKRDIKIVHDAVYNHWGINHYMIQDIPMKSWLNQWDSYTNTSYKEQPILAVNGSEYDKLITTDGWFMPFLPDLNQRNPLVANYLIQNAIWLVQKFGFDAYRIDTYMYNDMDFMNRCNAALKSQFPDLFLFGESLATPLPNQAAFVQNNINLDFACNLESTVDYQLHQAMAEALNQPYGWNEGVNKLYQTLSQDYLYQNPDKLITYLDNHDEARFFSVIGEDERKFKMGLTWLLTLRGIPQLYYGTELLVKNFKDPTDAEVRKDFPGGWAEDKINKFKESGRTAKEKEIFSYVQKLISLKKEHKALGNGEFMQFLPFGNGIYAYFRYTEEDTIMIISNASEEEQIIETKRFAEVLKGKQKAKNLMNDEMLKDLSSLKLKAYEVMILEILN